MSGRGSRKMTAWARGLIGSSVSRSVLGSDSERFSSPPAVLLRNDSSTADRKFHSSSSRLGEVYTTMISRGGTPPAGTECDGCGELPALLLLELRMPTGAGEPRTR